MKLAFKKLKVHLNLLHRFPVQEKKYIDKGLILVSLKFRFIILMVFFLLFVSFLSNLLYNKSYLIFYSSFLKIPKSKKFGFIKQEIRISYF